MEILLNLSFLIVVISFVTIALMIARSVLLFGWAFANLLFFPIVKSHASLQNLLIKAILHGSSLAILFIFLSLIKGLK